MQIYYQHDLQVSRIYLVQIVCCFVENELYIPHMYCDLALSKENIKEGFLADYKCSSVFFILMIFIIYIL